MRKGNGQETQGSGTKKGIPIQSASDDEPPPKDNTEWGDPIEDTTGAFQ